VPAIEQEGIEQARKHFSALVEDASRGKTTIITKHGVPCAAIVPVSQVRAQTMESKIGDLRGSGKGLWGRSISDTIHQIREEWD